MTNLTHTQPQPTEDFSHLSPAELSSLVDLVTAQIEQHEREVKRLEYAKKKLMRQAKKNGKAS